MKIISAVALTLLQAKATSAFVPEPISANSKAGVSLLSKSRLLDSEDNGENEDENDGYTWMQDYSIKFLGCHHVATWSNHNNGDGDGDNGGGDDEDNAKVQTARTVRYRLCPSSSCSKNTSLGCSSGYGDYIVDLNTFLASYLENKQEIEEENCAYKLNQCGCGGDDDGNNNNNNGDGDDGNGDDGNGDDQEMCEYKCYTKAKMYQCIENNPYYDEADQNQDENEIDLADYTQCAQYDGPEQNGDEEEGEEEGQGEEEGEEGEGDEGRRRRKRKLDEEEVEYFLGPYCADKGTEVHLGMFTEDTCSEFAGSNGGSYVHFETFGTEMPYSGVSLIDRSCYTCKHTEGDDDDVETRDTCTTNYQASGKCETRISTDAVAYPNEYACSYIEGLKRAKRTSNGVIFRKYHGSKTGAAFIAFFGSTFLVLGCYACYLKKRVFMAKEAEQKLIASRSVSPNSTTKKPGFFKSLFKSVSPRNVKRKLSFKKSNNNKAEALM